jgi:hypothetical protein
MALGTSLLEYVIMKCILNVTDSLLHTLCGCQVAAGLSADFDADPALALVMTEIDMVEACFAVEGLPHL